MKLSLTAQEIREKAQMIIQGISSRDAQVFTSRNGKHYMENWDWFQGVALFGLYEFYRDTGDKGVLEYLVNWFDEHIAAGLPERTSTACARCSRFRICTRSRARNPTWICAANGRNTP